MATSLFDPGEPLFEEFCDRGVRPDRRGDVGVRCQRFELPLRIGPSAAYGPRDPPAFPRVRVGADINPQFKGATPPLTDRTLHLNRPDDLLPGRVCVMGN